LISLYKNVASRMTRFLHWRWPCRLMIRWSWMLHVQRYGILSSHLPVQKLDRPRKTQRW